MHLLALSVSLFLSHSVSICVSDLLLMMQRSDPKCTLLFVDLRNLPSAPFSFKEFPGFLSPLAIRTTNNSTEQIDKQPSLAS